MKSKANISAHPLHPILIVFPVAFFIGALLFDLLYLVRGKAALWQTGSYLALAGIIAALVAAVPGIIDYFYTVPPKSTAKNRATKHAILNLTNVFIFVFAFYYRRLDESNPYIVVLAEVAGVTLLSIAGWMGGTLVHRNQIGVDHRYPYAGKWKETYIKNKTGPLEVATADELKINQMKLVHLESKRIVIGRTENGYVAFSDHCTHRGGSLADGALICDTVQCPWHGSLFDVYSGKVKAGPAKENINCYPVEERDGKVFLLL